MRPVVVRVVHGLVVPHLLLRLFWVHLFYQVTSVKDVRLRLWLDLDWGLIDSGEDVSVATNRSVFRHELCAFAVVRMRLNFLRSWNLVL